MTEDARREQSLRAAEEGWSATLRLMGVRLVCLLRGHRWQNRVAGGSLCTRCRLWQDRRV